MSAGKLKVFRSLGNWLSEFRLYQRDKNGQIIKANDHLMDAMRYLIMTGRQDEDGQPRKRKEYSYTMPNYSGTAWMGV